MSIIKSLTQIRLANRNKSYFLYSECVDNEKYELLLSSLDSAYKCMLSLNQHKLNDNEWDDTKHNQLKEALRNGSKRVCIDTTIYNYEYNLSVNGNQTELSIDLGIYQSDDDSEPFAKTPVIALKLEKANEAEVVSNIFTKLLVLFDDNQQNIKTLESENKKLVECCESAISKLDQFTVIKAENDASLFSKFSAVLNEKKDKIRELQQKIDRQ